MQDFMTPPKHVNFHAKKLFGEMGRIVDGSVAYIELNGGGPTELHTHEHNHLFIVTEGAKFVDYLKKKEIKTNFLIVIRYLPSCARLMIWNFFTP